MSLHRVDTQVEAYARSSTADWVVRGLAGVLSLVGLAAVVRARRPGPDTSPPAVAAGEAH